MSSSQERPVDSQLPSSEPGSDCEVNDHGDEGSVTSAAEVASVREGLSEEEQSPVFKALESFTLPVSVMRIVLQSCTPQPRTCTFANP